MFRLEFADNAIIAEPDQKQPYVLQLAKVQLLRDCGICQYSQLPVVRLNEDNDVKVVLLR